MKEKRICNPKAGTIWKKPTKETDCIYNAKIVSNMVYRGTVGWRGEYVLTLYRHSYKEARITRFIEIEDSSPRVISTIIEGVGKITEGRCSISNVVQITKTKEKSDTGEEALYYYIKIAH